MKFNFKGQFSGLKGKLIRSHLWITVVGVLLLSVILVMFVKLRLNVNQLVDVNMPTVQVSEDIQTSLLESLVAIRSWMNVAEPVFKENRQQAWKNGVLPGIDKLTELASQDNDVQLQTSIVQLHAMLADLQMWQWRIEDIVQTPGNNVAKDFLNRKITPSAEYIIGYITKILNQQYEQKSTDLAFDLANLRGAYIHSLTQLSNYILSGDSYQLADSRKQLKIAQINLKKIENLQSTFSNEQQSEVRDLSARFKNYLPLVEQLILLKNEKSMTSASSIMLEKAEPLAQKINAILNAIIKGNVEKQHAQSIALTKMLEVFLYCLAIFILVLILMSLSIATLNAKKLLKPIFLLRDATKKMAAGKLDQDIEIVSNDEIGELTKQFNQMHQLRKFSELKMRLTIDTAIDPIITINAKGIVQTCNSATTKLLEFTAEDLIGENISMIMPEPYHSEHDQYLKNHHETKTRRIIGKAREVTAQTKSGVLIPIILSVSEMMVGDEQLFTGIIRDIRQEKSQAEALLVMNKQLEFDNKSRMIASELESCLRGIDSIDEFSQSVLKYFSQYFKVLLSMFFMVDAKKKTITLVSGYGYKERRDRATQFKWGEGLVGESVKSQEVISILNPDKDYFKISSGAGDALPNEILIVPLTHEKEVLGVIELCYINTLSEIEKTQIIGLCKVIVIHLKMVISKQVLNILFNDAEKQRQNLQLQETKLRSSNEELESQADALKQSEEELRSTNEELQSQMALISQQQEELIKKSDEVSKSSQYKSEFLANMSHELRTPLNSLLILAQSFMKNKQGNLSGEQLGEAKIIYEAGTDLLTLINDVLDISKVEAGKMTLEASEIEIKDVMVSLENQFTPLAKQQGLQFIIDCSAQAELTEFKCDQLRLLQILKNLLSNAIKFTSQGSVTLGIDSNEQQMIFYVIDTGIGIAKDKQDLVFAEFQQADGSTSRKYGGTGLGLSISKKLANLMGGKLSLESIENKGSTFTLTMPTIAKISNSDGTEIAHNSSVQLSKAINLPDDLGKIAIEIDDDRLVLDSTTPCLLVIDDDKNFNQAVANIIKENQFHVLQSLTAKTGLELAAAYHPRGVILDLGLPDMNGVEVLSLLKQDSRTHNIPVHIVSGQDKSNELLALGAFSYLTKPVGDKDISALTKLMAPTPSNKILIIEDDRVTQKGLREIFTERFESIEIKFVETADEAKTSVKENVYACIVVDLGLPDGSGIELIRSLVVEFNFKAPIIVYTARELTPEEYKNIKQYTDKIVIKGIESMERLLDELQLFITHVEKASAGSSSHPKTTNAEKFLANGQPIKFDNQRILLVDDDLRNTFALSRALEAEGLQVTIADNGQLALEKIANEEKFDCVLMDMMMPIMDGYEAIQKIRANEDYATLPIIALTAKATIQDKDECLAIGADAYMSKPIDVDALLVLIMQCVHNIGHADEDA